MGVAPVRRRIAGAAATVMLMLILGGCGASEVETASASRAGAVAQTIASRLAGIPQHGRLLGDVTSPVKATLYGDLECPYCREFVLGPAFSELINHQVRAGALAIVYRSVCTATCAGVPGHALPTPQLGVSEPGSMFAAPTIAAPDTGPPSQLTFVTQQVAAYAAGRQDRFWEFAMLFLHAQRTSGSGYVTEVFLDRLARETSGLNYERWTADRRLALLTGQVAADQRAAALHGVASTPTLVFQGPRGTRTLSTTDASDRTLTAALRSVR
jgi:protein-disulfide isomerase